MDEIILVDGGSQDQTVETIQQCMKVLAGSPHDTRPPNSTAPTRPRWTLIESEQGRGAQMNRGAELASGDVLLFLHMDCQLPPEAAAGICQAINSGRRGGSFRHRIDDPHWQYRWIEWGDGVRQSWLQMPYGDQAIFVERSLFAEVGGYPEVPLMEDVRFVRKLRRRSRLAVVNHPVVTNARRWRRRGVARQFLLNQFLLCAERLGVSLERLARIYYG